MKKNKNAIPNGTYRIIKIGRALFELIYETIIDNQEDFFDVDDGTKIITHFDMNWEKGELICTAHNYIENQRQTLNTAKLFSALENTTDTLYAENRYIELTAAELQHLQNEAESD